MKTADKGASRSAGGMKNNQGVATSGSRIQSRQPAIQTLSEEE